MSKNELYHHGIKGQRWGVRRYQNPDGTLTAAGKKKYSSQVKFEKAYKPLTKKKYSNTSLYKTKKYLESDKNKMRTNEILLPKDMPLTRISTNSNEAKAKALYVNFAKDLNEVNYYKEDWARDVDTFTAKQNDWYENSFKLKTDIRTPSLERRKEAVNAIINADEKMKIELGKQQMISMLRKDNFYSPNQIPGKYGKSFEGIQKYYEDFKNKTEYTKREYKDAVYWTKKDIDDFIKSYDERKKQKFDAIANDKDFKTFMSVLPTSKKLMNAYINELKKDGFNAVFDDNAGAKAAFIIFDAKNLDQVKSDKFEVDYSFYEDDDYKMSPWLKKH